MINRSVLRAFPLLIALFAYGCSKAPVIVAVDMDRVVKESQTAGRIIGEVEAFAKSAEAQINQAADQVRSAASDPRTDQAQVNGMKAQFNEMCRQADEQVDLRRRQAEDEVHLKLEEALKVLAKEKGWDLVVRKGPQSALWVDEAMDQTSLVIKRMDGPAAPPK